MYITHEKFEYVEKMPQIFFSILDYYIYDNNFFWNKGFCIRLISTVGRKYSIQESKQYDINSPGTLCN